VVIAEYKGFKAYFASMVPGLAFLFVAGFIMAAALLKNKKMKRQFADSNKANYMLTEG